MNFSRRSILLLPAFCPVAFAAAGESFEVASIKLSANQNTVLNALGLGPPIPSGPVAVLSIQHATLRGMLSRAFAIRYDSVVGPSWIDTVYYDVTAKVPAGAGRRRIADMLRNLLVERFDLRLREEQKSVNGWALIAPRSTLKLKKTGLPEDTMDPDADPDGAPDRHVFVRRRDGQQTIVMTGTSMQALVNVIWFHLDEPVEDLTGLKGAFDITIRGDMEDQGDTLSRIAPASLKASLNTYGLELIRKRIEVRDLRVESGNKTPKPN